MTDKVVRFPGRHVDDGGMTDEQWQEGLLALHQRLTVALTKDRKQIDNIRMVLSIDDITDLCQVIEDKLGPEWFSDDV